MVEGNNLVYPLDLYLVKFLPSEIFQYVEAHIAKQEFVKAMDQGASFEEALKTDIAMEEIAKDSSNIRKSGDTMALQDTAELPQKKQRLINFIKFFRSKEKSDA